jgi:nitrite reductase/ring-hydroxylating ferredoxin subunit
MIGRFLSLFRGQSLLVRGTSKLTEGHARKIDVGDPVAGGKQIVLCRVDGELYALDAVCPHEGGRLLDGPLVEGRLAHCPLHNFHFDPKTGAPRRGACANAKTYKVREKNGDAHLWI